MAFSNELLDQLLAGCERPEDILGPQGLFAQLKKALAERALGAELGHHLAQEAQAPSPSCRPAPPQSSQWQLGQNRAHRHRRGHGRDPPRSGGDLRAPAHSQASAPAAGLRCQGPGALRPRAHRAGDASPPGGALRRRHLSGPDQHGDRCGAGGGHRVAAAALAAALSGDLLRRAAGADPRRGDGAGEGRVPGPRDCLGRHQGRAGAVDRAERRGQVLAPGHDRAQDPRGGGCPGGGGRRAQGASPRRSPRSSLRRRCRPASCTCCATRSTSSPGSIGRRWRQP